MTTNRTTIDAMARRVSLTLGLVFTSLFVSGPASTAEINVLAAGAVQSTVVQLADSFKQQTGHEIKFTFGTVGALVAKIEAGERADAVILTPAAIDRLIGAGTVRAGTRIDVGQVGMGVAVRAGAPQPDISTPDAFKRAVVSARTISYGDPAKGASSGIYFAKLLERLGLADSVKTKSALFPLGALAMESVAKGENEIGVGQVSEIMAAKGVILVGQLPGDLNNKTVYAAGLVDKTPAPEATQAFLRTLVDPAGQAKFALAGFEPAPRP